MKKIPCQICGRIVANYYPAHTFTRRGSVAHNCPHGKECIGGHPNFRQQYIPSDSRIISCLICRKRKTDFTKWHRN